MYLLGELLGVILKAVAKFPSLLLIYFALLPWSGVIHPPIIH